MWVKPFQLSFAALGMLYGLSLPVSAEAHTVLEKVSETGVLTAGTSKDAFPFAYADAKGQLTGYSVDMLQLIKTQVESGLKRPVTLKLVAVDPDQRIPKLLNGDLDIVCDASSFTWARDQDVDFSISYGITGTRLLTKRGSSLSGPDTLRSKRIGVLPQTTNELAIRKAQPQAQMVLFKDRAEGYKALQEGKIDAFASDGILLEGWMQQGNHAKDFEVQGYPYSKEGIACMVPENNSTFLDTVNYSLFRFTQGFLRKKPTAVAIFERWFGPMGAAPLTQDLQSLVNENMQLILDFREELPDNSL